MKMKLLNHIISQITVISVLSCSQGVVNDDAIVIDLPV